ncbi:MAG: putative membrane protein [Berkelbacteria bacterium GW2011_GWA2_35_9]|uniref:Putative membrane protein n=1 Tax=Berkelbacteria bacterium GW2011_GWA2_35_9 TaxID=1618333 RepID=A0A0G0FKA1_9BACT|nr:MAG: putative membrane protein [Berkelbacteria bacterium GW2011_GWA2_35_9]
MKSFLKRSFVFLVAIGLLIYFSKKYLTDLNRSLFLIKSMKWYFLAIALFLQYYYFLLYSRLYQKSFELNKIVFSVKETFVKLLSANFINLTTPIGSFAGYSIFYQKANRDEKSMFGATIGIILSIAVDFLALFLILSLTILTLYLTKNLSQYELSAYGIFSAVLLVLFFFLTVASLNPKLSQLIFKFVQKLLNKFFKTFRNKNLVAHDWHEEKHDQLADVSEKISSKGNLWQLFKISLSMHLISIASLIVIFISFKNNFNILNMIVPIFAGYSIGYLFRIISPTPQGIGVVEGIMPYVFNSLGIDLALATIVTLIYRGISIWLPALIGFVTFNLITKKEKGEENGETTTGFEH